MNNIEANPMPESINQLTYYCETCRAYHAFVSIVSHHNTDDPKINVCRKCGNAMILEGKTAIEISKSGYFQPVMIIDSHIKEDS